MMNDETRLANQWRIRNYPFMAGGAFNMPTQAWAWHPTGRIRPAVAGKMPAVQPKAVQQPGGCLVGRH